MIFHWPNNVLLPLFLSYSIHVCPTPGPKCHWHPGQIWPCALNHHVPRDPMWPNRWKSLGQKIWSTHIFRDARIKLKTSRILTSILLSDPVRDQTSIFKVTSCLITSSKTQPKSTESRNFFADNEFSFFSLFFEVNSECNFWYENFCGLILKNWLKFCTMDESIENCPK